MSARFHFLFIASIHPSFMRNQWRPIAARLACAGVLALQILPLSAGTHDDLQPNYATRMTSPVDGVDIAPKLRASRSRFPMKVVILNNFYLNDHYYAAVKEACFAWVQATKNLPAGGLTLSFEDRDDARGADVVIRLCNRDQIGGFSGFTDEYGPYAVIQLAANEVNELPVSDKKLKRVAMHEFGHALGIWGHSSDPNDIMSLNDETTKPSPADINTLRLAYASRTDSSK